MTRERSHSEADQADSERPLSRRDILRASGKAITTTGVLSSLASATASAADVSEFAAAKWDEVEITNDTEYLERYAPLLDLRGVPRENYPTLRGWKATSTDADVETDVAVYACEYAVQRDVINLTSHAGDHEWIYVFTDKKNGEVRAVSYTAYHWLRGYVTSPETYSEDGGDHPMFTVAPTYHNYIPSDARESGVLRDVKPLGDVETETGALYQWLANGMAEDMEPGAVHNPWLLAPDGPLEAWWREDGSGRLNRWIVNTWAFIGLTVGIEWRGSEQTDFGDASI